MPPAVSPSNLQAIRKAPRARFCACRFRRTRFPFRQGYRIYAQPIGLADKLAGAFTAKTGVEVEQFQGTTGEILARLETEKANPAADVVILASWSDGLSLKAGGLLESYTPANAGKINKGWIDADSTLFGYSASAVGVIYNTTIYPELNADWAELADVRYQGDIAIPDPEKSGACKDFLAGLCHRNR